MIQNQTFGQAIEALKQGKIVSRKGWNGKNLFVFRQVPSEVPAAIIPKMTSLPQAVKDVTPNPYENKQDNTQNGPIIFNWIHHSLPKPQWTEF